MQYNLLSKPAYIIIEELTLMKRVVGAGGFDFECKDSDKIKEWYNSVQQ